MDAGDCFPVVKRLGLEADHSHPTGAEVKKMSIYTYIQSPYILILTMPHNTQNYWVLELSPSSGILENRKHDVLETDSVSITDSG
jgi:hypothetical protein